MLSTSFYELGSVADLTVELYLDPFIQLCRDSVRLRHNNPGFVQALLPIIEDCIDLVQTLAAEYLPPHKIPLASVSKIITNVNEFMNRVCGACCMDNTDMIPHSYLTPIADEICNAFDTKFAFEDSTLDECQRIPFEEFHNDSSPRDNDPSRIIPDEMMMCICLHFLTNVCIFWFDSYTAED